MSDRTRVLRYKRSALASMGAQEIMLELESIVEACDGIRYYIEQADGDETLLNALDGDEDEAWEFRMAFADLSAQAVQDLLVQVYDGVWVVHLAGCRRGKHVGILRMLAMLCYQQIDGILRNGYFSN